ncbi:MAG: amidohydrolase [Steroidobacteraceae bacterium]
MTANLRVTMIQADLAWHDPATNRRNLAAHFRGLAGHTDLIVLPEMFTTGFSMETGSLAETMAGATVAWLREESAAIGCAITGSLIVEESGQHYNRLVWATPDGGCAHYDKRHLFRIAREDQHYAPGKQRLVVTLKGWRVCPLICYDLRFPVWSRNRGDYDVLLYVANWPSRRRTAWSALLRARAIENVCYVVGVNRVGKDGNGASYTGDSVALDFLGQVLGGERGGDFVETVVLDRESLATFRSDFPVHLDADDFELKAGPK